MMTILIFILFLGPLIFFHELGHFLFARLFGVRVETFSLGFGPKIFRYKRKDTEYALSIIPLGGYVKMFGDDPAQKDKISEADRKFSYNHKSLWARFWIVFGGPLANFLLAYFIFFALLLNGERLPEIRFGVVQPESPLYQMGVRSGDVVKSINGRTIEGPSDLEYAADQEITSLQVERLGTLAIFSAKMPGKQFLETLLAAPPFLRKPLVVNNMGEVFQISPYADRVQDNIALEQFADLSSFSEIFIFKKGEKKPFTSFKLQVKTTSEFISFIQSKGFFPIDLMVKSITMSSPADKVGLKSHDVVVSLQNKTMQGFEELRAYLQTLKTETVELKYFRSGALKKNDIKPNVETRDGKEVKLIGIYSAGEYQEIRFVHTSSKGVFNSAILSFGKTWESFIKTADGFKKLVTGEVSMKNVGGPIAIGKVATDSFNTSLSYFFQIMALISVNLAIINLFPIPVLDGGHILFMIFEFINRGPLSRRKMEIAQQVGLSFLLLLMCMAIFNDVSRFF